MADKGTAFSAAMVRALLDGRKTMTRRLVNPQPPEGVTSAGVYSNSTEGQTDRWTWLGGDPHDCDTWEVGDDFKTGYAPGDRLYVREAYFEQGFWEPVAGAKTKGGRQKMRFVGDPDTVTFDPPADYRSAICWHDPDTVAWHKRLGRFMSRSRSRLWLEVTEVRVQRLQEISEEDARAEGIEQFGRFFGLPETDWDDAETSACKAFMRLWNSLHTTEGETWDDNPWIVAVSFNVHQGNIDEVAG